MPRSPFELAFDHVWDECAASPRCSFAEQRLCPEGRALFDVAHDACKRLAAMDLTTPRAKA